MATTTHILDLPWTKPPLTANMRFKHWAGKAHLVKTIRNTANLTAKVHNLPTGQTHATVALHYQPRDNRRRDEDNLVPTLKALCDGLTDYGLTPDDTPQYMRKTMPTIHPAKKGHEGKMWLEITLKGGH